jgi:hypothetical protein
LQGGGRYYGVNCHFYQEILRIICKKAEYSVAIYIIYVYNILWFYMIPYYAHFAIWQERERFHAAEHDENRERKGNRYRPSGQDLSEAYLADPGSGCCFLGGIFHLLQGVYQAYLSVLFYGVCQQ